MKRRLRRNGLKTTVGQILFKLLIALPMSFISKKRRIEISKEYNLNTKKIPDYCVIKVKNINSQKSIRFINNYKPDLIILSGTRILSKQFLSMITCTIINIHTGITPKYRGVHGMYWAIANNDIENCGVTIHFIDSGIDTGTIIEQIRIKPKKNDNFSTYPLLQTAEAITRINNIIEKIMKDEVVSIDSNLQSNIWSHPTFSEYIKNYYELGVK